MDSLPIEIVAHIFRYLSPRDVCRFRQLNKISDAATWLFKINDKIPVTIELDGWNFSIIRGDTRYEFIISRCYCRATTLSEYIICPKYFCTQKKFNKSFGICEFNGEFFRSFLARFLPAVRCSFHVKEIDVRILVIIGAQLKKLSQGFDEIMFSKYDRTNFQIIVPGFVSMFTTENQIPKVVFTSDIFSKVLQRRNYDFNGPYDVHFTKAANIIWSIIRIVMYFTSARWIPESRWKFIGDSEARRIKNQSLVTREDLMLTLGMRYLGSHQILNGNSRNSFDSLKSLEDVPASFGFKRFDGASVAFKMDTDEDENLIFTYQVHNPMQ